MNRNLDERIRMALSKEDEELIKSLEKDPGLLEVTMETLAGRYRIANVLGMVAMILMMIGACYCFWQLYWTEASQVKELIAYSVGGCLLFLSVSVMKIWFWMLINRNDTVREVKRLEFKVSRLLSAMEK